jgi:putative aminopeptidase FrvX
MVRFRLMRWALALILGIHATLCAQGVSIQTVSPETIQERFGLVQSTNEHRAAALRKLFEPTGCPAENWAEQIVKGSKLPNLICTRMGTSDRTIVVMAHYDKVNLGQGAIDNWSGAALLPSLYQCLGDLPRNFTFKFPLTTDEEKGLYGSRFFTNQLSKEDRANIAAAVNIDSVGLHGPTYVWASRADKTLLNSALRVASALKLPLQGMNIDKVGDSDSHPFADRHIPVIDFHSLTSVTFDVLHSAKDVPSALDPQSYVNTFSLLCFYLGYLDTTPGAVP